MRQWLAEHAPLLDERVDTEQMMQLRRALVGAEPQLRHDLTALRIRVLEVALGAAGYTPDDAASLARSAFDVFYAARNEVQWFDDVEPLFRRLSARGLVLGGLSNGNADFERTGLSRWFAFHFCSADVGSSKPAPDMFHAALERAGVPAPEALHVGDSLEHDVAGARAANVAAVWLTRETVDGEAPDGVARIRSLHELDALLD